MTDDRSSRPYSFLVSTPGGRDASDVLAAIDPVLALLGGWRHIPHPESSLAHAAAEVEARGGLAVHLAIGGADGCYLTPAVRTLFLPLWDFPEVPAVDLNRNGRMNWARIAGRVDLILAPSSFTLDAFRDSGVETPAIILPIPAREGWEKLPTWGPGLPVSVDVPHTIWEGAPDPDDVADAPPSLFSSEAVLAPAPSARWSTGLALACRRGLRRIKPYFSNASIHRIDGYRHRLGPALLRPNPVRILGGAVRLGYRHVIRRWIGERAHLRLRGLSRRLRRLPAPQSTDGRVRLSSSTLTLNGLVYSAVIDYADTTTDDVDLLSAAVHAFRDRPDVTLLIRLLTTPGREAHDLARLAHAYHLPRIETRCRVVVVAGPIEPFASLILTQATSYHIEIGRSSGLSLPMVEALAAGRPVIAPGHSSYLDWIDEDVGLIVASNPEPAPWPIDPLGRHATLWHRAVWTDLRDRLIESVDISADDPDRYEILSANARRRVADRASVEVIAESLREALDRLPSRRPGAVTWG